MGILASFLMSSFFSWSVSLLDHLEAGDTLINHLQFNNSFASMGSSTLLLAKRALVVVIRTLAVTYDVVVNCTRDSPDKEVLASFRKVALRVHPDHGGNTADQQKLNDARAAWENARKTKDKGGRPKASQKQGTTDGQPCGIMLAFAGDGGEGDRKHFRINSQAALFTYMGFEDGLSQWDRFCDFVARSSKRWEVKHWCATLETTKKGKFHAHLMLQFRGQVDRTTAAFCFEGLRPNTRTTDLCGEGLCRKRLQMSIDRGFFYVFADKKGTCRNTSGEPCVMGNYAPDWTEERYHTYVFPVVRPRFFQSWVVWRVCGERWPAECGRSGLTGGLVEGAAATDVTFVFLCLPRYTYQVLGAWPEKLWKQKK